MIKIKFSNIFRNDGNIILIIFLLLFLTVMVGIFVTTEKNNEIIVERTRRDITLSEFVQELYQNFSLNPILYTNNTLNKNKILTEYEYDSNYKIIQKTQLSDSVVNRVEDSILFNNVGNMISSINFNLYRNKVDECFYYVIIRNNKIVDYRIMKEQKIKKLGRIKIDGSFGNTYFNKDNIVQEISDEVLKNNSVLIDDFYYQIEFDNEYYKIEKPEIFNYSVNENVVSFTIDVLMYELGLNDYSYELYVVRSDEVNVPLISQDVNLLKSHLNESNIIFKMCAKNMINIDETYDVYYDITTDISSNYSTVKVDDADTDAFIINFNSTSIPEKSISRTVSQINKNDNFYDWIISIEDLFVQKSDVLSQDFKMSNNRHKYYVFNLKNCCPLSLTRTYNIYSQLIYDVGYEYYKDNILFKIENKKITK